MICGIWEDLPNKFGWWVVRVGDDLNTSRIIFMSDHSVYCAMENMDHDGWRDNQKFLFLGDEGDY